MELIAIWLIGAVVVGAIGNSKTIGFGGAFLLSILLSPLIGLVITLFSPSKERQQQALEQQKMQTEILQSMANSQSSSVTSKQQSLADEIQKLKSLHDSGAITEEEFTVQKQKLSAQ